jgi:phytanoyl-CoA dioxygenase PhyH
MIAMRVPPIDLLTEMLETARLPHADVEARWAQAQDPEYWRALVPGAHVLGPPPIPPPGADGTATGDAVASLRRDGFFHLRGALDSRLVLHLNAIIDALAAARWPPAFAFVYDEFWMCARLPAIVELVTETLGRHASQIPHVWTHVVQPLRGAAGWNPHLDGAGRGRMSVWIGLTDASIENGCMYVVPRGGTPDGLAERIAHNGTITVAEALAMLKATQPMPTRAGDALGWTFDVLHWGGRAQSGQSARRSVSLEFIAAGETPQGDEHPLVPLGGPPPPLDARLRAIGAGLVEYRKFEPSLIRFERLAERLCALGG